MHCEPTFGFRIVGRCTGERKLIDWHRAFAAYCAADARAGVESEAYLSAFTFGDDFRDHLSRTGTTKGFDGLCGAAWLWFDLDRDEAAGGIEAARRDAAALALHLCDRFALSTDSLLLFYSGSKGFHVGLPLAGFTPEPGPLFNRIARRFAEQVAATVPGAPGAPGAVAVDGGVYDKARAFRAPNSKHAKTGRHKRRLTLDELTHLSAARIVELAAKPNPFDVADLGDATCGPELPAAWHAAADAVRAEVKAVNERRAAVLSGDAPLRLNRSTFDFIREGAGAGDRHRLLFSAAANLAEVGAPLHLCRELLGEPALDCGLPPAEVERQIRCGFEHGNGKAGAA